MSVAPEPGSQALLLAGAATGIIAPMRARRWSRLALPLCGMLASCTPADDWREMRPDGGELQFAMPCRPQTQVRALSLAGVQTEMTLRSCVDGGQTFAMASAELGDPTRVGEALEALGRASQANVKGRLQYDSAAAIPGMTPNAAARLRTWQGHLPQGQEVTLESVVFARGTRVFQASVVGVGVNAPRSRQFFESIKAGP